MTTYTSIHLVAEATGLIQPGIPLSIGKKVVGKKDYGLMYDLMALLYLWIVAKMDPRRIGRKNVSTKPFGYFWHPPKKVQCHSVLRVQANRTTLDVGKCCKTLSFSSNGNVLHKSWNSSSRCTSPTLPTTPANSSSSESSTVPFRRLGSLSEYLTLGLLFSLTILKTRTWKRWKRKHFSNSRVVFWN